SNRNPRDRKPGRGGSLPLPAGVALEPPLPEVLRLAEVLADPPREHEEDVAQPVHVAEGPLADRLRPRQRQDLAFRPAAHGAGQVEKTADAPAPRQYEGPERRELLLAAVHQLLELLHLGVPDTVHALVGRVVRGRQLAAEVEELVLQ